MVRRDGNAHGAFLSHTVIAINYKVEGHKLIKCPKHNNRTNEKRESKDIEDVETSMIMEITLFIAHYYNVIRLPP